MGLFGTSYITFETTKSQGGRHQSYLTARDNVAKYHSDDHPILTNIAAYRINDRRSLSTGGNVGVGTLGQSQQGP